MTLKRLSQSLFLLAPMLLAACAPATTPAAETVKAFYAALNTKDIDRAAAFIGALATPDVHGLRRDLRQPHGQVPRQGRDRRLAPQSSHRWPDL